MNKNKINIHRSKILIFTCCLLFMATSLTAQSLLGSISGTVWDGENNERLTGASVYIQSAGKGVNTDEKGEFTLEHLPVGDYLLTVSFIGYQSEVLPFIFVCYFLTLRPPPASMFSIRQPRIGYNHRRLVVSLHV